MRGRRAQRSEEDATSRWGPEAACDCAEMKYAAFPRRHIAAFYCRPTRCQHGYFDRKHHRERSDPSRPDGYVVLPSCGTCRFMRRTLAPESRHIVVVGRVDTISRARSCGALF